MNYIINENNRKPSHYYKFLREAYIYCDTAVIKNASVTNLLGKMCHFMLSGARLFI